MIVFMKGRICIRGKAYRQISIYNLNSCATPYIFFFTCNCDQAMLSKVGYCFSFSMMGLLKTLSEVMVPGSTSWTVSHTSLFL